MNKRYYTEEEIQFIKDNSSKMSNTEMGRILNRSRIGIAQIKKKHNIADKPDNTNDFEICGKTTKIFITKQDGTRLEVLIDTEDLDRVIDKRWYVNKRGYVQHDYMVDRKKYRVLLHRFITDCPEHLMVDHIDGNKLDNRKSELRVCTKQENQLNLQNCKVGHRLVYRQSDGEGWRVQVKLGQHIICIKYYYEDDYEQACQDAKYLLAYVAPHSGIGRTIKQEDIPNWIKQKVDNKIAIAV